MTKLTYEQTIRMAIEIKETMLRHEQLVDMMAIRRFGDAQAIKDGKLEEICKFVDWLESFDQAMARRKAKLAEEANNG